MAVIYQVCSRCLLGGSWLGTRNNPLPLGASPLPLCGRLVVDPRSLHPAGAKLGHETLHEPFSDDIHPRLQLGVCGVLRGGEGDGVR